MSIIRTIHNENFVVMNKVCLQDKKLSWKAKGIYSYIMSLPNNWNIRTSEIENHSTDGRTALLSGIKELINNGYCERVEKRNNQGLIIEYDYILKETPDIKIQQPDLPLTENPLTDNDVLLNNNSINIESSNKLLTKKPFKKKQKKKSGIFNPNSLGGKLAQKLLDKIELNDPSFPTPDLFKWEKYFNKMIYVEGYNIYLLDSLIEFAHSKSFWKSIILSPYKLKANFSTLRIQKNNTILYKNKNKDTDKDVFEQAKKEGINNFN